MPYGIAFFAILLLVSGLRGTERDLGALLKGDFIGKSSFLPWMVSIVLIGSIGYFAPLKKATDMFLALLLIVLVLDKNGGVFTQLQKTVTAVASATTVGINPNENASPFAGGASGGGAPAAGGGAASAKASGPSTDSRLMGAGAGALSGAMAGAEVGSIIPGIGTAVGAVAGAAIGAGVGAGTAT